MNTSLPALSLIAVPGRRAATLDLAREIEARGFAGIYCPSFGDGLGLCQAIGQVTDTIEFGTSIVNMYTRHVADYAETASLIHEVSEGRFQFGVGVSHSPINDRLGLTAGRPLADIRDFVEAFQSQRRVGEMPPIVLAAMRDKMCALAVEIADGMVFANAARSDFAHTLERCPERDADFFLGGMIPTCISDDREAAAAVMRKTLTMYVGLPNYRNYWKQAGYGNEMEAIEVAQDAGDHAAVPELMSNAWLQDCTLHGPADEVREGLKEWCDAGLRTPILVPSSVNGGQLKAFEEVFDLFRS
ncbi:MAG: LLM class flavin-dependent oxidoreductase [Acidimicrobiales bacterium]|nr:LLM class flavin-dependent oxidoreductase [Acidimicrobiales bacterium]MDG1877088.1 LLM class flavin-dependent oxidoreductase [Acidimicrobiales bacterium]